MNKRIFGIKISTILTAVVCLVAAVVIWTMVKYQLDIKSSDEVCSALLFH